MKIGFFAMSGIRALDPELLRLGLTLPGFVERSKTIASLPSLGLLTLAGLTPDRHEIHYVEVPDAEALEAVRQGAERYDLAAISSFSAQIFEAYELADLLRERGTKVVLGGLHVSSLPDEAKAHADAICIGEGELTWPRIVEDAERGQLKGFYAPEPGQEFDFANTPMPAFELLDIDRYNRLTVQASRGCPFKCEFCASSILLTPRYKQKPAEKVLAEVDKIREIWKYPFIEFADDNAFVNHAYWKALLPELKKRRVRWFAETDISVARDKDLLDMMRDSGCAQVLIGLESPTAEGLGGVELKSDWKLRRLPEYKDAIRAIQSRGISVNGCFVLGLDGHGEGVFDAVAEFVESSGLHETQITFQTPFPGTPLYKRLLEEGRILKPGAWDRCTLFDLNFRPKNMTVEQLTTGFRDLMRRLYSEEAFRGRRERFRGMLKSLAASERAAAEANTGSTEAA